MAVVFDSADYALETYMDFIAILKTAFRHYVDYHNGRHHPKRKGDLGIKTLCLCLKQRPGILHCEYYICCMMSSTSAYRRHPNLWKEEKNKKRDVYKDDELLELVGDLCGFIIDEVVSSRGAYHDLDSDFGSNPRYQHFCETHRLSLGH